MIDIMTERLITITKLAKRIDGRGSAKHIESEAIKRWIQVGIRVADGTYVKLEGYVIASQWQTSLEAFDRFNAKIAERGRYAADNAHRAKRAAKRAAKRSERASGGNLGSKPITPQASPIRPQAATTPSPSPTPKPEPAAPAQPAETPAAVQEQPVETVDTLPSVPDPHTDRAPSAPDQAETAISIPDTTTEPVVIHDETPRAVDEQPAGDDDAEAAAIIERMMRARAERPAPALVQPDPRKNPPRGSE